MMEWLVESSIRFYLGAAVIAFGAWLSARGGRMEWGAIRMSATDPGKSLALMQAFRVCIIGLSLATLGVAWLAQSLWLAILAAVVLGEETFESTMAIGAIRRGRTLVCF
jgi:hypothetical protein